MTQSKDETEAERKEKINHHAQLLMEELVEDPTMCVRDQFMHYSMLISLQICIGIAAAKDEVEYPEAVENILKMFKAGYAARVTDTMKKLKGLPIKDLTSETKESYLNVVQSADSILALHHHALLTIVDDYYLPILLTDINEPETSEGQTIQ